MLRRAVVAVTVAMLAVSAWGGGASADTQAPEGRGPGGWWAEVTGGQLAVNGTYIPLAGDFSTNNSYDDLIWYAPGPGVEQGWANNGNRTFTKAPLGRQVNGTYTPIVGDFVGDGLDDIFWYAPGTAPDSLWENTGNMAFTPRSVTVNGTWQVKVLEDSFAKDDLLFHRSGGGAATIWDMANNGSYTSKAVTGPAGTNPVLANVNGDDCDDIFWYAPGTTPDRYWAMDCQGGILANVPQSVNGTYTPLVGLFSPEPGTNALEDILWWTPSGTSTLWQDWNGANWKKSSHSIGLAGTPIVGRYSWGFVHIWSTSQPDRIWYDQDGGPDYYELADNTEIPSGYRPVVANWFGAPGIFWYKAGSAPEYLFT